MAASTKLDPISVKDVHLWYQDSTDKLSPWQELPVVDKRDKRLFPIQVVLFDGDITIRSEVKGAWCELKLTRSKYEWLSAQKGKTNTLSAFFRCGEGPACTFGSNVGDNMDAQIARAKTFPLATAVASFKQIRLDLPKGKATYIVGSPATTIDAFEKKIRLLTTGKISADVDSPVTQMLRMDERALRAETAYQRAQLGLLKGCRIKANNLGRRNIVIEVWTGKATSLDAEDTKEIAVEAKEFDFGDKKLGMSYRLQGSRLFPDQTEQAKKDLSKKYKILDNLRTDGWDFSVIKRPEWSKAPLVGMLSNQIPPKEIPIFCGEDYGLSLEPIENDVLGDRSRSALSKGSKELDRWAQLASGFIEELEKPSSLPLFDLFCGHKCNSKTNMMPAREIPAELTEGCTAAQAQAIENGLNCKISAVWGPPGTGKSTVLARLIVFLAATLKEPVLATALSNAAVDALLTSCLKRWNVLHPDVPSPFVRLFSETQIRAQLKNQDAEALQSPYHLDNVRLRHAQSRGGFEGYLSGRQALWDTGEFSNEGEFKAYKSDLKRLNEELLWDSDASLVVFCTITNCASQALFEVSMIDGKPEDEPKKRWFKAKWVIIDEAGVPNRPQMMIPIMWFQRTVEVLVLAGDPKQLPGLCFTDIAQGHWQKPKCYFEDIIDRDWPTTFLNVQFRMHANLYAHLPAVIYKRTIHSPYLTSNPSPFLQTLLRLLPLRVQVGANVFEVTSYMNFIDVNGAQEAEDTSSFNDAEVEGVSKLVYALVSKGAPRKEIAVLTGYKAQQKRIYDRAKREGWADIAMAGMTIDSSQGAEWKILIISLVTARGSMGFMGHSPRANVGTSRQGEMIYFVGSADYWILGKRQSGAQFMREVLHNMHARADPEGRAPFVIRAQGLPAIQAPPPPPPPSFPEAPTSPKAAGPQSASIAASTSSPQATEAGSTAAEASTSKGKQADKSIEQEEEEEQEQEPMDDNTEADIDNEIDVRIEESCEAFDEETAATRDRLMQPVREYDAQRVTDRLHMLEVFEHERERRYAERRGGE